MKNTPSWFNFFKKYFPGATLDTENHTLTFTAGAAGFKPHITPTGDIDGENTLFHLPASPAVLSGKSSLYLHLNGQVLYPAVGYTLDGTAITMTDAPQEGDVLDASYFL